MSRVSANGPGDQGSIQGRVIPKTLIIKPSLCWFDMLLNKINQTPLSLSLSLSLSFSFIII